MSAAGDPPLACDLGALSPAERERHRALGAQLGGAVRNIRELPNGYVFELDPDAAAVGDVGAWMALESKCCPFLAFVVRLEPEETALSMELTASHPGIREFLREELAVAWPRTHALRRRV